jgi:hypothetical protein
MNEIKTLKQPDLNKKGVFSSKLLILSVIASLVMVLASVSSLALDDLMGLQGNVEDDLGYPVDGNLTVSIYDAAAAGNLIYTSNFTNGIRNGMYDIMLGNTGANLTLEYGRMYYMDLAINEQDIDFSGGFERQIFQSSTGLIRNLTFGVGENLTINGDLIVNGNFCLNGVCINNLNNIGPWDLSGTTVYPDLTTYNVALGTTTASLGAKLTVAGGNVVITGGNDLCFGTDCQDNWNHNSLKNIQGGGSGQYYHIDSDLYDKFFCSVTGGCTNGYIFMAQGQGNKPIWASQSSINHDNLSGLQGGSANEYYHLNLSQYTGISTVINNANSFNQLINNQTADHLHHHSELWQSDNGGIAVKADADGKVGIGTASPEEGLDIRTQVLLDDGSNDAAVFYKRDSADPSKFYFRKGSSSSYTDLMTINNNGDVVATGDVCSNGGSKCLSSISGTLTNGAMMYLGWKDATVCPYDTNKVTGRDVCKQLATIMGIEMDCIGVSDPEGKRVFGPCNAEIPCSNWGYAPNATTSYNLEYRNYYALCTVTG